MQIDADASAGDGHGLADGGRPVVLAGPGRPSRGEADILAGVHPSGMASSRRVQWPAHLR